MPMYLIDHCTVHIHLEKTHNNFLVRDSHSDFKKILGIHMDGWAPFNNSVTPQISWQTGCKSPVLVKVKIDRGA